MSGEYWRVGVLKPDALPSRQRVHLRDIPKGETLKFLNETCGGHIEHVTLVPHVAGMYVHDEGLLIGLQLNWLATALYQASGYRSEYPIVGPVVLCGGVDEEGNDLDLPITLLDILAKMGVTVVGP